MCCLLCFFFRVYTEKEHLAIYLLFPEEIISYFLIVSGIQCFEIFVGPMCFSALRIWLSFFMTCLPLQNFIIALCPCKSFFLFLLYASVSTILCHMLVSYVLNFSSVNQVQAIWELIIIV